ncbi:Hsp20/alpha crystallin family protein [Flavobacterium sp. NRK1]|jgi:HSP20 family protein|uniref:Hsp20/alpha crystallin family protein n=1 Tax=Flavobacterium sp. NRK1 TaxID=2954929 RepID=UPI002093962D|nr:Hsp20/alpha crystallin family protein [Flavobacterium sp. NRK1]MCO6146727.1 Hsp20/alpha crystallin family protein [Flavobacterium sp. NRK1]
MNVVKRNSTNGFPLVMDQFFKDILGGTEYNKTAIPPVNVKETDTAFSLEIIAPGLKKENFNIEVEKELLTISSEIKEEKSEEQEGKFMRREFRAASFKRSFKLPENVKSEDINAAYQDGILVLNLPKKEEELPQAKRLIEIS